MAIRCASKALILNDKCVLLNRCRRENGSVYYDLPGGGQHIYETLEETLIREVKEETGYEVRVIRFAALAEEIYTDADVRQAYPDYTHRIFHIFVAELNSLGRELPTEKDFEMEESVWIPIEEVTELPELCPSRLQPVMSQVLESESPIYLGTEYITEE
jgi:8-oxo-dGTP pyrophosphatase MutT (NUDIX family)